MKKIKSILGILVLMIGVLGTGYAYWADTLVAEATVATGNFDIEYCEEHTAGSTDGIAASSIELSDNHADIAIDKLAPGCEVKSVLCFKNLGNVNAILKEIKLDLSECSDEDCVVQYKATIGETIINAANIEILKTELEKLTDAMYIEQGECKSIELFAFIPYDEENCQTGQKHTCKFEIAFDWRQSMCMSQDSGSTGGAGSTEVTVPADETGTNSGAGSTEGTLPADETGSTGGAGSTEGTLPADETGTTSGAGSTEVTGVTDEIGITAGTGTTEPADPAYEKEVDEKYSDYVNSNNVEHNKVISSSGGGGGGGGNYAKLNKSNFGFKDMKLFMKYLKYQLRLPLMEDFIKLVEKK
ncbi:MAG: hypothetical protein WBH44_09665 [Proteocatella sp.]